VEISGEVLRKMNADGRIFLINKITCHLREKSEEKKESIMINEIVEIFRIKELWIWRQRSSNENESQPRFHIS
jgi:hypothetical protein